ncbi:MAG: putative signal transducing protein [Acidobacteriota bacterium]
MPLVAFTTAEEAQLARGLLQAEGIPAEIVDKQTHPYPYGVGVLEEVTLLVPPDQVERAEAVLDRADAGTDTVTEEDVEPSPGDHEAGNP